MRIGYMQVLIFFVRFRSNLEYIYMFLADLSDIEFTLNPLYSCPVVTCGQADEQTVA